MFAEAPGMSKLQADSTPLTNTPFQHADHQEIIMKVPNGFPGFTFACSLQAPIQKEPAQMAIELGFDSQQRDTVFCLDIILGVPLGILAELKKKDIPGDHNMLQNTTPHKISPNLLEVGFK